MSVFADLVQEELTRARRKHENLHSFHEAPAVIDEELHEFRMEVYKREGTRDLGLILDELVQVAAMCHRTASDLGLVMS